MSRLFLRIAVAILVVVVASFAIVQCGARSARRRFETNLSDLLREMELARSRLEAVEPDRLERELRALREKIVHPVRLADLDSDEIPAKIRARLRPGHPQVAFAGHHGWVQYIPIRRGTKVLVFGPTRREAWAGAYPLGRVAAGILGVVGLMAFLLAAPLVRRLRGLERAAARISEGDLQARAAATSKDAIGSLARRFNAMADKVQGLLERQQELIQAVSHELRTPTARIRFGLEMLAGDQTEQGRQRRIEAIDEDLVELDQLVEELLLYIRSGEGALELNREEVDPEAEIAALVERLRELRSGVEVQIRTQEGDRRAVSADRRFFRRALSNLLSNALKHARSRVVVQIEAGPGESVQIGVRDDGPGVPEEQRQRIFEPFARLDASRSRESGGAGLGLAIVDRIVRSHGGEITVGEAEEGGAAFLTRWPVAR
jgi:two-component system sensor histidine kinase RstB